MPALTESDARKILAEWMESFGRVTDMAGWYAHVTEGCTEFHPIYPALIEAPMFQALQGTRFQEPRGPHMPRFTCNDEAIRVYENAILRVAAGSIVRLEPDGTLTRHLNRETMLFVRTRGRWLMAHNHISPAGNDPPYGHNQFSGGGLQYTR